jgi:DNA-binding SARP family transcriptional activator
VRLLLAYMVLNRARHVGREELIGSLWPANPPLSRDAALRTLLSRLRSVLGRSALVGRDELNLELTEPAWIDTEAAESELGRAQDALDRGDARVAWALAQVPFNITSRGLLPGSEMSWLEPRRRELVQVRLQALEVIGRAGLTLGGTQLGSVERASRALIDSEPYRESGYVLLMQALAARGNVAEGLRVFERLRTLLRDELGTAPAPDTIAAHERLLHPSGRIARPAGDYRSPSEQPAIQFPAELRARGAGPLVGRVRELEQLEHRWELERGAVRPEPEGEEARLAPGGAERVILLAGDPGIGKTRLIAELARRAHESGAVVLAGASPEDTLAP